MKYLIDTNIIVYACKGLYPSIEKHFSNLPRESIFVPSIVIGEIEYGARKATNYDQTIGKYNVFLNGLQTLGFGKKAAKEYGLIRANLEKTGQTIGACDLLIAAIAIAENCILVTNNVKEFSRIPQLKIEDWTK